MEPDDPPARDRLTARSVSVVVVVALLLVAGCSSGGRTAASPSTGGASASTTTSLLPVTTGPLPAVEPPPLLAAADAACRSAPTGPGIDLRADDACVGATIAYVWGYPLVTVMRLRDRLACVTPVNQLLHARSLATPSSRTVVAPNNDTLYSTTFLDLRAHPVELSFPPVNGRYANFQMMDAYTNTFADIGTLTTGTHGGRYAIVGPTWKGTIPAGLTRVVAPTPDVWLLGRTEVRGQHDLATVHDLQDRYVLTSLSSATGRSDPEAPAAPARCTPVATPVATSGTALFDEISADMAADPPPPADATTVAAMAAVGIGPGRRPSATTDPSVRAGYQRALRLGPQLMLASGNQVTTPTAWHYGKIVGTYGTDFVARAAVAQTGLGANLPTQAVYFNTSTSGARTLTGRDTYVIHFAPGELPPVTAGGFWSVTMYDPQRFLVANPIDRYSIGDRTPGLVHGADGSLDIYVSGTAPRGHESNWLPAPDGPFALSLRLYAPAAGVEDSWRPPAVRYSP
ncbi:MAG TPA: DUF1254 domain-containing protein [Acidimicrobiales bacterium]|nr:DUF1254 domain-containing protein [Acidimicrobiales bacterium]